MQGEFFVGIGKWGGRSPTICSRYLLAPKWETYHAKFVKRITCFLRRILLPIQLHFGVLWLVVDYFIQIGKQDG